MPVRDVELVFPLAGLDRSAPYQKQAPYTTPDALNVMPLDVLEARARGGSRPGLTKAYGQAIPQAAGQPIRMLAQCRFQASDRNVAFPISMDFGWTDAATLASLAPIWSDLTPTSPAGTYAALKVGKGAHPLLGHVVTTATNSRRGVVVLQNLSVDTGQPYSLALFIDKTVHTALADSVNYSGTYVILCKMNDTTPDGDYDSTSISGYCVAVELTLAYNAGSPTYSWRIIPQRGTTNTPSWNSAAPTSLPGSPVSGELDFRVVWPASNRIQLYLDGTLIVDKTDAALTNAGFGSRFGFSLVSGVVPSWPAVSRFWVNCFTTTPQEGYQTRLAVSGGREFWRQNETGILERVPSGGHVRAVGDGGAFLNDRFLIQAVERSPRLYIGDHGSLLSGTQGTIPGSLTLRDATKDFDSLGVDPYSHYLRVISGTVANLALGYFQITSALDTDITVDNALPLAPGPGAGSVSYEVVYAPKMYRFDTNVLSLYLADATKGFVPINCACMCLYRDRIMFAGQPENPAIWYLSRQGNPHDWDYGATDAQRAVAGTSTSEVGKIGEPIRALIPGGNDYVIMACDASLWRMTGDPAYGGVRIDALSRAVGCVGPGAWCYGPEGETYVMSRDGLYVLAPGGGMPVPVSKKPLPDELREIPTQTFDVLLAYDVRLRGLWVFLTGREGAQGQLHFWVDATTGSFWPMQYAGGHEPTAILRFDSHDATQADVLLGCRDGYVRKHQRGLAMDDATAVVSRCALGPILPGGFTGSGVLDDLSATLDAGSGDVDWAIHAADDAESAVASVSAKASGSFSGGGLSYLWRPRVRGHAIVVRLSNGEARPWALEKLTAGFSHPARQRKF